MMRGERAVMEPSTMTIEEFVRRVWQARHVINVAAPCRFEVRMSVADWINVITEPEIGTPNCPVRHDPTIGAWTVHGIKMTRDFDLRAGDVRLRAEVAA